MRRKIEMKVDVLLNIMMDFSLELIIENNGHSWQSLNVWFLLSSKPTIHWILRSQKDTQSILNYPITIILLFLIKNQPLNRNPIDLGRLHFNYI